MLESTICKQAKGNCTSKRILSTPPIPIPTPCGLGYPYRTLSSSMEQSETTALRIKHFKLIFFHITYELSFVRWQKDTVRKLLI